ncbi:hypothetical protein AC579_6750 [Pseudocercospora musae]|uniref:AAA+ ATPase domain-containing protein n=1 Tax=Pseudocercospora musae TaxID=113226 RepID=A0A139I599_9PEZI|nr:hypothetical protein AC579_6750 [Pseudocercospora musae]
MDTSAISLEAKLERVEQKILDLERKYAKKVAKSESSSSDDENDTAELSPTVKLKETASTHGVRIVTSRLDIKSRDRKDFDEPKTPQEKDSEVRSEQAVLLRKVLDDRDLHGEIEIHDPALKALLRKLLWHYPRHWAVEGTEDFTSPYEPLILNWDLLWAESGKECEDESQTCAEEARQSLRQLLSAILQGSGDAKLDSYLEAQQSLKKSRHITFQALWTIFPPGALVWTQLFTAKDQILVVSGPKSRSWPREGGSLRPGQRVTWALNCMAYDFDGKGFRRKEVTIRFDAFEGIKPIASLPACPLDILQNPRREDIRSRLLKRGKLFRRYCTVDGNENMYTYTGSALVKRQVSSGSRSDDDYSSDSDSGSAFRRSPFTSPPGRGQEPLFLRNADVMVDFQSYFQYSKTRLKIGTAEISDLVNECHCKDCELNSDLKQSLRTHYDQVEKETEFSEWDDVQLMMCPPRVLGYALREKRWAQLDVECLRQIEQQSFKQVMSKLHLDGADGGLKTKELLYQLVKNHGAAEDVERGSHSYEVDDIVAEKGKGLVFLLYGSPGVGKTSTAQMIARVARKPLISISVADVGTNAQKIEKRLNDIFELATTWKAILLIDEADVFLQSRRRDYGGHSAEGSGLVSIFLRFLEYYRGILFLTTNQIAQFDVAVQSRVHVAIKYDELKMGQTVAIFMNFVDQYHSKGVVGNYSAIKEYAEEELHTKNFDGRQIRNIVTIAMGHARGENSTGQLELKHIKRVVWYVECFKNDLYGQMIQWENDQANARRRKM